MKILYVELLSRHTTSAVACHVQVLAVESSGVVLSLAREFMGLQARCDPMEIGSDDVGPCLKKNKRCTECIPHLARLEWRKNMDDG